MADLPVRLDTLIAHVEAAAPPGDQLARVGVAAGTSTAVADLGDRLVGHFVDEARAAGFSWTDIGAHLGVTKQAARKRFVPKEDTTGRRGFGMFNHFSRQSRAAVVLGQEVARELHHDLIEPAHLLVALCRDECRAAALLDACGAPPDRVEADLLARMPAGRSHRTGHIPFAPAAKKALEQAVRHAKKHEVGSLGSEFLLLGIIAADTDVAHRVLTDLGVTADRAAAELDRLPEGE